MINNATLCVIGALSVMMVVSCRTSSQRVGETENEATRTLFELRQRYAMADNDTGRWNAISDLGLALQSSKVDVDAAREQRMLWYPSCTAWKTWTVEGDINTSGDEYAPVSIDDTTMLFTRARHATTLCTTSDIYSAHRQSLWHARNVGRPFNDCHENSALSYNPRDSTVYVYGQYYLYHSRFEQGSVLSPSYPSDAAQQSTIPYIFDHVTDYTPPSSSPPVLPIIVDHSRRTHHLYTINTWTSQVIDRRGDIYALRFVDGELRGFPERIDWPVSGGDFESDAVMTPDGSAMFFTSDRPNDLYAYDGKEAFADNTRLHNWGNSNIYVVPIKRNSVMTRDDIAAAIREGADTARGLNFMLDDVINTPLAERTPSFSPNGDTMFFASNGLPGYGGMDIYYSTRLKQNSWLEWSEPMNMGAGLNTTDDELWFTPARSVMKRNVDVKPTYYFARRVNGRLDIMQAERLLVVRHVRVTGMCQRTSPLLLRSYNLDGSQTTREIYDDAEFGIPRDVREFGIVVGDSVTVERRFMRCVASSDTLDLASSDLLLEPCNNASITTSPGAAQWHWTLHVLETNESILRTVDSIRDRLVKQSGTGTYVVSVMVAPAHEGTLATSIQSALDTHRVTVMIEKGSGERTVITVTQR